MSASTGENIIVRFLFVQRCYKVHIEDLGRLSTARRMFDIAFKLSCTLHYWRHTTEEGSGVVKILVYFVNCIY